MSPSNFFALILRMKFIDRWGLMRGSFSDDLEEHCFETAVIAHCLCTIGNTVYHRQLDAGRCAVLALYHDATEILTGDMPTPVKYYNPEIKDAYKAVEAFSADKLAALLPPEFRDIYAPLLREEADEETHALVKAADKLSAYIKCVEELSAGNEEYRRAEKQIRSALEQNPLPEVSYFMEHFMPAFGLTLDDLQA